MSLFLFYFKDYYKVEHLLSVLLPPPENRGRGLEPERIDRIHKSEVFLTGRINVGLKV